MVNIAIMLCFSAKSFKFLIILNVDALSKPLVGSSKNNILGIVINYVPMYALLFSPPLIPLIKGDPILEFSTFFNPNSFIINSILELINKS